MRDSGSVFSKEPARQRRAFSLIEVVAAIGIFAIGMISVLGLFTPVAKSVGGVADADASAKVSAALQAQLQGKGIAALVPLLKHSNAAGHDLSVADAKPGYDITTDVQLLFASRDGTKVGTYADPVWNDPVSRQPSDIDKFFEIALIRNETLSPNNPVLDATAPVVAYVARVRWPAFVPDSTPGNLRRALPNGYNPTGTVRFDHSQKLVLFFSGSVTR